MGKFENDKTEIQLNPAITNVKGLKNLSVKSEFSSLPIIQITQVQKLGGKPSN